MLGRALSGPSLPSNPPSRSLPSPRPSSPAPSPRRRFWFHSESFAYRRLYMAEEVSAPLFGYTLDRPLADIAVCVAIGTAYRAIAYGLLIGLNRSKQR